MEIWRDVLAVQSTCILYASSNKRTDAIYTYILVNKWKKHIILRMSNQSDKKKKKTELKENAILKSYHPQYNLLSRYKCSNIQIIFKRQTQYIHAK